MPELVLLRDISFRVPHEHRAKQIFNLRRIAPLYRVSPGWKTRNVKESPLAATLYCEFPSVATRCCALGHKKCFWKFSETFSCVQDAKFVSTTNVCARGKTRKHLGNNICSRQQITLSQQCALGLPGSEADTHGTETTVGFDRVDWLCIMDEELRSPICFFREAVGHLRVRIFQWAAAKFTYCCPCVKILLKTFWGGHKTIHWKNRKTALFTTKEMDSINWILRIKRRHKRNHILYLEQMPLLNSQAKWPAEWHGRWSRKPSPLPRSEFRVEFSWEYGLQCWGRRSPRNFGRHEIFSRPWHALWR